MLSLSYDLHIHSCLSPCGDNESTPCNIVGMAYVKGLDVIAVTDHNSAKNCPAAVEAAKEFGINSNSLGFAKDGEKGDASLYSIFSTKDKVHTQN